MSRYLVGIDLGTSHTVVAYAAAGSDAVRLLEIPQLVGPGEVAARPLLPSVRYHPAAGELDPASLALPWAGAAEDAVIGRYARDLGARVPGRLVASAKSWLSHPGVDRSAAILPWGAPDDVAKVSPLAASASYLAHVRAAWDAQFAGHPLAEQDIVLTIPASFDEGARALTVEAARLAGLPRLPAGVPPSGGGIPGVDLCPGTGHNPAGLRAATGAEMARGGQPLPPGGVRWAGENPPPPSSPKKTAQQDDPAAPFTSMVVPALGYLPVFSLTQYPS